MCPLACGGNAVSAVFCGNVRLESGRDYAVDGESLILRAAWLDTLAADAYTLDISYDPLGIPYVEQPGNVAPASTVLTLNVDKAAGSVTLLSDLSKYYDGLPVADIAYSASAGRVTVEYKAYDAPDDKYTTEKPSAVGNYTVRVTVAESETHTGASATANFSIHYLPICRCRPREPSAPTAIIRASCISFRRRAIPSLFNVRAPIWTVSN